MRLIVKPVSRDTMEYWAFVAQVASAVAVVVSLVYVAVQVRENTKLLRSQAHYNALAIGQEVLATIVSDQAMADLMSACYAQPDGLTAGEWYRCSQVIFILFNTYEYHYYQHRDQAIPKELWVGADHYFKGLVATAAFKRFWKEYRLAFDDPFRSHVEAEIARIATQPPPKMPETAGATVDADVSNPNASPAPSPRRE